MSKIAILTDTGCGLTKEYWTKDTYILPLYIHFKDESYKDMIEIDSNTVYNKMDTQGIPKTSIPSVGEIKQIIAKIKNDGYSDIIYISLSSGLSGVHNAVSMVVADEKDINIKILDTKNVWLGTGFFVLFAQDLIKQNPNISFEDFYEKINKLDMSKLYFYLDTFKYLVAGGRVGKVMGAVGSLLKIMPVISCNEEGIYYSVAKTRSQDKAIVDITNRIKDFISKNSDKKYYIAIACGRNEQIRQKFETILEKEIKNSNRYIYYDVVTPAIGVHSGPGVIGVGTFCFE